VNAYHHTSRVFFHAGFDDLAARPEPYDVAIVSASVTTEETIRAVELAGRAVVLELTDAVDPLVLAGALAPGFPSRTTLGEVAGIGEPSVMLLLARDEDTLLELTSGASRETAAAELEKEMEHA
ncbi:MAG: hypothetical protein M3217_07060, partial [Actinomycetota bacterium]|nr:hypothetical protein [Actinomycetota bacterium]